MKYNRCVVCDETKLWGDEKDGVCEFCRAVETVRRKEKEALAEICEALGDADEVRRRIHAHGRGFLHNVLIRHAQRDGSLMLVLLTLDRADMDGADREALVRSALSSKDPNVRMAAMSAAASWADHSLLRFLREHEDTLPDLQDYKASVVEGLEASKPGQGPLAPVFGQPGIFRDETTGEVVSIAAMRRDGRGP